MKQKKGRVTGVGGIFFKCEDDEKMRHWYRDQLGMMTNDYGVLFEFRNSEKPEEKNYLQLGTFKKDTDYFKPSNKEYMINLRVDDLDALLAHLSESGIEILDEIQDYEYGRFAHIIDPEGNKIELWEPIDKSFEEMAGDEVTK